jgi:hypothetical protein
MAEVLAPAAALLDGSADFLGCRVPAGIGPVVLAVSAPVGAVIMLVAALAADGPVTAGRLGWGLAAARQARVLALTPAQVASPLARRPYDLRHGGVSLRLNAGVPATQVAEWAGHSVEVLLTIYAKCIEGRDRVWFERIDEALGGGPA